MGKILIAGCGYLGKELAKILLKNQQEVWAVNRSSAMLPNGTKEFVADLARAETLNNLPRDFNYIFYTAAAKEHSETAYEQVYFEGMKNILEVASQMTSLKRIFFSSSTSVYHQSDASTVDENSPTLAQHFSGRLMLKTENLLRDSSLASTSVRFSGLYGRERTRLVNSVREGTAKLSSVPEFTNRIHIIDAARMLFYLMNLENLKNIYIGSDCSPSSKNEVLLWISEKLKVELTENSEKISNPLRSNKRCSNKRILETGFSFLYPSYREGYGEIIGSRE